VVRLLEIDMENETLAFLMLCAYCLYLGWDNIRLSKRVTELEYDVKKLLNR
jgi:hypothetical protein